MTGEKAKRESKDLITRLPTSPSMKPKVSSDYPTGKQSRGKKEGERVGCGGIEGLERTAVPGCKKMGRVTGGDCQEGPTRSSIGKRGGGGEAIRIVCGSHWRGAVPHTKSDGGARRDK